MKTGDDFLSFVVFHFFQLRFCAHGLEDSAELSILRSVFVACIVHSLSSFVFSGRCFI